MKLRAYLVILTFSLNTPVIAELVTGVDETAKLPFWEWRNEYMSLRFVQRLPDQSRAYFAGRGFKQQEVKFIASHCIFQTVYKNVSSTGMPRKIQHDIRDWRYHHQGKSHELLPREDWKPIWQQRNVKQAQIIAFEWSLLPSRQIFSPGDYNWGMTVFNVPHGDSFNLDITWKVDGKMNSTTIEGITCSKDVYIAPQ